VSLATEHLSSATGDPAPVPAWVAEADMRGWTWAGIAWHRASAVPGAQFDARLADWAVEQWPKIFRLTDLHFARAPFRLALWQEVVVRLLVGWKIPAETVDPQTGAKVAVFVRLFRRLSLWIPRKNGKTEFMASLALYFWAIDAVYGGQGYSFAYNQKQAKIVLAKMKAMIAFEPRLAKAITPFGSSLFLQKRMARFEALTGKAEGKHGLSAYVSVGDEMHEWTSRDLDTAIRESMAAQLQPIELFASTAGLKSARTGFELFRESESILAGPISPPTDGDDDDAGLGVYDPTTLVVMFALGEDDDWRDEANWRRVNPNLGISPTLEFLRREAAYAKKSPRAESHFRRYHLNQWVDAVTRWLPMKKWDACCSEPASWRTAFDDLKGRSCYLGFDISSRKDITALVWLFPPEDDETSFRLVCKFWAPEAAIDARDGVDRDLMIAWRRIGAINVVPDDCIDQAVMQSEIKASLDWFDVKKIGFDSWNAAKLYTDLVADGVDNELFLSVSQTIAILTEPSKKMEELVLTGLLDHGGHPVLRWMAANALTISDTNGNFRPSKKHSREKIDGVSAANNALAVFIRDDPPSIGFIPD
jgi:phage terminase large subunit-like protein